MPKPQRSTLDRWLDQFSDFDPDTQEKAIDTCALLHRQTKRFAARNQTVVSQEVALDVSAFFAKEKELNGGEQ